MAFKIEENENKVILRIEGAMTVYEVASIRSELAGCLEKSKGLVLKLDEVSDCDTAGVQLLCSAYRTARDKVRTFSVSGAPDVVRDAIDRIGLDPEAFFTTDEEA
ncbi:MAG: anti-sigma factor antagonist [Planctomycetaceae bacterium]|nr:MAG: anti-sigma factor antagonist [Planctomycetaceae bacterium]